METKEFLLWIRDRLVDVYDENPFEDFVQKLERVAQDQDVFDWPILKDSDSGEIVAYYNPKFISLPKGKNNDCQK
jgi:hypothetical protein